MKKQQADQMSVDEIISGSRAPPVVQKIGSYWWNMQFPMNGAIGGASEMAQESSRSYISPITLALALLTACSATPATETVGSRSASPPVGSAAQAVRESKTEPQPDAEVLQARSANVPCPSQDFEEFLKVFANRGDVRLAYTAQPWKVVIPYYWSHDNMPGDPRFPKWEEKMLQGAADSKIAFDDSRNAYVSVESAVAPGEVWRPDDQRTHSSRVLENFTIKKLPLIDMKSRSGMESLMFTSIGMAVGFIQRAGIGVRRVW